VGGWTLNHLNVVPSITTATTRREMTVPSSDERRSGMEAEQVARGLDLPGLVPDVRGLGIREVVRKAKALGLRVIVKGSGMAAEQSPTPGLPLRGDTPLVVTFRPPC